MSKKLVKREITDAVDFLLDDTGTLELPRPSIYPIHRQEIRRYGGKYQRKWDT